MGQLKSPCSQCKPIVINKFSEKKSQKEPYIIFIPCEIDTKVLTSSMDRVMNPLQLCSSLIFWHSDKRIVNSRTGISQPCLSITFQRPSRSDHLSAVVNVCLQYKYALWRYHYIVYHVDIHIVCLM
ncbi:unnamed protein product [Trichobilharzia regenti]|nr:unnamed protein product [Trichobilharzia regenti]